MSARPTLLAGLAALAVALALPGSAAPSAGVSMTVDRKTVSTKLGDYFVFRTTIRNPAATATRSLIAHLNLLSLRDGVYVDPEDWSTQRTRYLGTIPAGGTETLTWRIHAVNVGSFAAYITVLRQDGVARTPATSAVVKADVAKRKGFDDEGIVPLALGIPIFLGLLTGGLRLVRRRR